MDEFKDVIKEWLDLDEEVKSLQNVIKEKKLRMNKLSEYIITFMNSENKQVCNIGDLGSLVLKTRNSTSGLKKEYIMDILLKISENDEVKAKGYLDEIYNKRTQQTKSVLKFNVSK